MTKFKISSLIFLIFVIFSFSMTEYPKAARFWDNNLYIYFFDVGQGDSILVKMPDRTLMLVDGGPSDSVIYRLGEALPFWVRYLDYVMATHPHADHIRGLLEVRERYSVGEIIHYGNDFAAISKTEEEFRKEYDLPSKTEFNTRLETANLKSIILLIDFNKFEGLLTADAENPVQAEILPHLNYDIEVIKVPHQGARDSLNTNLLQKLRPDIGIISVGSNSYGHPHKEVLQEYERRGIPILRTDEEGTIIIRTDGEVWQVLK